MSVQTEFADAFLAIKVDAKDTVSASVRAIDIDFLKRSGDITDASPDPEAVKRQKFMKQLIELLSLLGIAITSEVIAAINKIIDSIITNMIVAHQNAADDEGVEVDDLDTRFDDLARTTFTRISKSAGRNFSIGSLVTAYQDDAVKAIELMVDRAIARNVTADVLAQDVAKLVRGGFVDVKKYGLADTDVTPIRTFLFAGERIIVSESYNAMREGSAAALKLGGFVEAAQWLLSPKHSVRDVCDDIALGDGGFGVKGMYAVSRWPPAPHPHCACYMGGIIVLNPTKNW